MEPIWACVSVGTVADQTQREPPTVGELIRFWRTQRRLTQMELALDAKLSTKHLSLAEPTLETAAPVAVATAMSGMVAGRIVSIGVDRALARVPGIFLAVDIAIAGALVLAALVVD
jgi:transcriptional regulator with XRE-family HTH domain